jgi:hypothetical protein
LHSRVSHWWRRNMIRDGTRPSLDTRDRCAFSFLPLPPFLLSSCLCLSNCHLQCDLGQVIYFSVFFNSKMGELFLRLQEWSNAGSYKKYFSQLLVAHTYNPSYSRGRDQEDCGSRPTREIVHKILSWKSPTQDRAGRVTQVAECLHSKHEALSSNPQHW